MKKWTIEYHACDGNDPDSEEYWVVTDGNVNFRCEELDAAEWLEELLNTVKFEPVLIGVDLAKEEV